MELTSPQVMWRPIYAVAAGATLFTAVQGLTYPLLSLVLHERGVHEGLIGINTSMMPLGMIMSAPFASRMIPRVGALGFAIATVCGSVACLMLLGAISNSWWWMPIRFTLGLLLASLFVVTDTWVNQLAAESSRGRVLGFYSMLTSIGFALGPAILVVVGTRGWGPFVAGAACGLLSLVPLLISRRGLPPAIKERGSPLVSFIFTSPVLLASAAASALADQVAMSMLPIFTLHYGMSVIASSVTLVFMVAGCIALQYPVGWLADRISRRAVYLGCSVATAVGAALLPFAATFPPLLWLLVFVWGGAYYGIYTLSLVILGERFKGAALVTGNAVFAAMWGVGGLTGTPLAGEAMQALGPYGLAMCLAGVFVLLSVAIALTPDRQAPVPA